MQSPIFSVDVSENFCILGTASGVIVVELRERSMRKLQTSVTPVTCVKFASKEFAVACQLALGTNNTPLVAAQ